MESQQSKGDLEQQLRQMILSNVKIGDSTPPNKHGYGHGQGRPSYNQPAQHHASHDDSRQYQSFRGNGRGFRGRPRGALQSYQQNHPTHEPFQQQNVHGNAPQGHDAQFAPNKRGHWQGRQGFNARGGAASSHHASNPRNGQNTNQYQGAHDGRGPPAPNSQLWHQNSHHKPQHQGGYPSRMNDPRRYYLDELASREIPAIEISPEEFAEKDAFRQQLQEIFATVVRKTDDGSNRNLSLQSFGSLRSGFATRGSDMDLVIVDSDVTRAAEPVEISLLEDGLPRRFEKELLARGIGARLLTRARVPIIKICETPNPDLLLALKQAREKWDALPDEEKLDDGRDRKKFEQPEQQQGTGTQDQAAESPSQPQETSPSSPNTDNLINPPKAGVSEQVPETPEMPANSQTMKDVPEQGAEVVKLPTPKKREPWLREKKIGPLDFPKDGVGIQCDINFFNPLGIHNTHMLYCYSLCDTRVRPMILFVKAWARKRKINSPYSGTLSSYGYVLMVLHYLINVARPPVLPNLQAWAETQGAPVWTIDGWRVHFWSDENAIKEVAKTGAMTNNRDPLGALLKSFFQYYATTQSGFGYIWMKDVLSLRTPGGILSKEEKGWTGAKTETTDVKEVRHRYLLAIEDPFELTHNVARTVTHPGIVAVRDEFRRAWRILGAVGNGYAPPDGGLLDELIEGTATDEVVKDDERPQPVGPSDGAGTEGKTDGLESEQGL